MGSDKSSCTNQEIVSSFNPRSRMGSDTCYKTSLSNPMGFNPRSRMGSDLYALFSIYTLSGCFNPRSRMGSDNNKTAFINAQIVSTHAPAWGATKVTYVADFDEVVSTHAPAWGATMPYSTVTRAGMFQPTLPHGERPLSCSQEQVPSGCFNPRSRMGSDRWRFIFRSDECVSTHAPAWGATIMEQWIKQHSAFQPTLPHGERRWLYMWHCVRACFNPRSRMGSDFIKHLKTYQL